MDKLSIYTDLTDDLQVLRVIQKINELIERVNDIAIVVDELLEKEERKIT